MSGKELKSHVTEEQFEDEKDRKIGNELREEADKIEVPDKLKPERIELMLREHTEQKVKRWKPIYTAIAAACCAVIVGGTAVGVQLDKKSDSNYTASSKEKTKSKNTEKAAEGTQIASAKDYDEVYDYVKAQEESQSVQARGGAATYSAEGASMDSSSEKAVASSDTSVMQAVDSGVTASDYSDTNVREDGVGEGDIVKTDGKNLYTMYNNRIEIVNIEKQNMEQAATIRLEKNQDIREIYIKDDQLVVVYTESYYGDETDSYSYRIVTTAEIYDVSNPDKPISKGKVTQSGNYNTMRVSGDYVYLLSDFNASIVNGRDAIGEYVPSVQGKLVEDSNICMPQYVRGDTYTVVSSFSLKNPEEKVDSKAIFGCSGLVYVSKNNIYVCESYYNSDDSDVTQTCIRKISYKDGILKAVGQTRIDGTLNDSFSLDEYEGNLRLVTTVSSNGDSGIMPLVLFGDSADSEIAKQEDTNYLYILDEKLNELSKIEDIARDEQVYSARFIGKTGYVVTYKQTDPLFSIDLSDPKNPQIIGELKIPGFSEYLHPYGDGLLLGIGMDVDETGTTTNGVKLSMFDISNPEDVAEVQKYVMEDCYSTNVTYEYKAAMIDVEKNMIGFVAYGENTKYYIFSYDESGFKCLFEREMTGYGNVRGLYAGEYFYLVSGNTVEKYELNGFKKVDDIVL